MSWRRLEDVLETKKMLWKESISVSKKFESVSHKSMCNKSISDKSMASPRQIQDVLIRTQQFLY